MYKYVFYRENMSKDEKIEKRYLRFAKKKNAKSGNANKFKIAVKMVQFNRVAFLKQK